MRGAYYNEIDPYAAQWLRNLIAAGHIADGEVDERSICDVKPEDIRDFTQCHFFAGIGVWSHALRLAQWPDTRAVWTGSCPCQPFSLAGKSSGVLDERHLWPHWFWLIEQCRPAVVFGEQVEAAIGHGWLDLVHADLEGIDYAVGAAGIPAAGVGAPHIRQRLWFVAHAECALHRRQAAASDHGRSQSNRSADRTGGRGGALGGMADHDEERRGRRQGLPSGRFDDRAHAGRLEGDDGLVGLSQAGYVARPAGPTNGLWAAADWLSCRDGKWRPVEPGTFPLAHGAAARVGRLRAYGNAIVPQVAAQVIAATMEYLP